MIYCGIHKREIEKLGLPIAIYSPTEVFLNFTKLALDIFVGTKSTTELIFFLYTEAHRTSRILL